MTMPGDPDFDATPPAASGRTFSIIVPYNRPPNHIPRRDLVLGAADNLWLEVSVVESDDPSAEALTVTGGIGGPAIRMAVWPVDSYPTSWDYGALSPAPGSVIWSANGTVSDTKAGTFDVQVPVGTLACWPRRCAYGLQLDWDGATGSELIATGILHVRRAQFGAASYTATPLLTDSLIPVLTTGTLQQVLVA